MSKNTECVGHRLLLGSVILVGAVVAGIWGYTAWSQAAQLLGQTQNNVSDNKPLDGKPQAQNKTLKKKPAVTVTAITADDNGKDAGYSLYYLNDPKKNVQFNLHINSTKELILKEFTFSMYHLDDTKKSWPAGKDKKVSAPKMTAFFKYGGALGTAKLVKLASAQNLLKLKYTFKNESNAPLNVLNSDDNTVKIIVPMAEFLSLNPEEKIVNFYTNRQFLFTIGPKEMKFIDPETGASVKADVAYTTGDIPVTFAYKPDNTTEPTE